MLTNLLLMGNLPFSKLPINKEQRIMIMKGRISFNIMKINVKLEIHAYAQEKLCDWNFDNPPHFGINGPEVMFPLSEKRGHTFSVEYSEHSKVKAIVDAVKKEIWGDTGEPKYSPVIYAFLYNGERYYIDDYEHNFSTLIAKYLDPQSTGIITIGVLVSCDAGAVGSVHPLRFYVRSHEFGNHHEAHVHVCDVGHQYEASVRISDGEVIAGKLPPKLAKLAKKSILADQEYYYNCWNTMTDGLKVDINHHYGYIQY